MTIDRADTSALYVRGLTMHSFIAMLAALAAGTLAMAADKFPANGGDIEITPILHSSVQIEHAGKVIQVDPWSVGDLSRAKPADLILITDDPVHHLDVKAIQQLRKPGAPVVIPAKGKSLPVIQASADGLNVGGPSWMPCTASSWRKNEPNGMRSGSNANATAHHRSRRRAFRYTTFVQSPWEKISMRTGFIDIQPSPWYAPHAAGVWVIAVARKRGRGKSEHPSRRESGCQW